MYVVENTSGSATRDSRIHKLPLPAQTVVWNATLTSADNWALGSTYTYDGYGSSAFGSSIPTTQGSLSPDSFTVGTTTHTVQILGVREGTDNRLYLFTDTAVSKSDLAAYAMEFTVDGSTTTLKVKDATPESNLGFYWAASLHSLGPDDWQAKTITVKLLLIVPGAPTGLTVTEGHHAVKLDWTAPAADGGSAITGYEVTASGGTSAVVTGSTSTSYTLAFLGDNDYPFQVRAVNANGAGPWSSAVTGTIGPATVTIAGDGGVNEGFNAEFTLTASKPVLSSSKPLNVSVLVSESEDMVASAEEGTKTVSFAMGDTTATLSVPTVDDGVVESDSVVTAAIQTNTDYTVGTDGSGTVSVTDQGATGNNPATGAPTITGTAQVGQTLTADTSGIGDDDGLTNAAVAYQWLADGADIQDATDSSYTLAEADEGKAISVKVSFTDDAGNAETLTSAATAAVEARPNSPATGDPNINGTAQVGETLTADTSGIADDEGLDNASFSYQWLADDSNISGATGETYTLADADVGKAVSVTVSFTDGGGNEESLTSAATGAVEAKSNSPATGQPAISGTALVGETLTADTSGIADEDGLDSVSYSYQWLAEDVEISGATDSTYTLASNDVGRTIKVRVSFTDDRGHGEELASAATAVVEAAPFPPLTASLDNVATSHDGESVFTFELRFSEEFGLSYKTLRDHAFTVTGGAVRKAQRLEQGSDIGWQITVRPDGNGDVTVVLSVTTDCDDLGAICTEDGRMLSHRLELTVSGPGQ